jgi:hypothetical protein
MIALLVYLIVLCIIFGLVMYVVQYIPIAQPFKTAVIVLAALILILILLSLIGVIPLGTPRLIQP